MFDHWSNVQVHASLSELHKAIDRAVSLHDNRAVRRGNTGRHGDPCNTGSAYLDSDATQGPVAALQTCGILIPSPAVADLVILPAEP